MPALGPGDDPKQADAAARSQTGVEPPGFEGHEVGKETQEARWRRAVLGALLHHRRFWFAALLLLVLAGAAYLLFGSPLQAWYHYRAAKSALQAYHNPQAIRHLQACLRIWPTDPDVLLLT